MLEWGAIALSLVDWRGLFHILKWGICLVWVFFFFIGMVPLLFHFIFL